MSAVPKSPSAAKRAEFAWDDPLLIEDQLSEDERLTRETVGRRLWAFYSWCADTDVPELHTLAATIEAWWPAVEVFLSTGITNARTEGTNRLVKQVKRAACGFRHRGNYPTRPPLLGPRSIRSFAA